MNDFSEAEKNPYFFYDKNDFAFLKPLEDNFAAIRAEFQELQRKKESEGWISTFPEYVRSEKEKAWQVFSFNFFSMRFPRNEKLCPVTAALIKQIPQIISSNFSQMQPHTHILPHKGYSRMQLRCHLPLIIPDEELCGLRVGTDTRHWREGELIVFDDSYDHEAWNRSDKVRVVLMFDIPNPKWGYSAHEISAYKMRHLDDKFLLGMASKERWQQAFEEGIFPL